MIYRKQNNWLSLALIMEFYLFLKTHIFQTISILQTYYAYSYFFCLIYIIHGHRKVISNQNEAKLSSSGIPRHLRNHSSADWTSVHKTELSRIKLNINILSSHHSCMYTHQPINTHTHIWRVWTAAHNYFHWSYLWNRVLCFANGLPLNIFRYFPSLA